MILRSGSFEKLANEVKEKNKKIIVYGAGVIGTVTTPAVLKQYNIEQKVECYIDNHKAGEEINLTTGSRKVYSVEYLKALKEKKFIVLLTISRFSEVLAQLQQFENLEEIPLYIVPMMCLTNFHSNGGQGVRKDYENPVIPKVIHYMWLGKKEIPQKLQYCIDSWKKYCPDYEIHQWNESNYDINKHLYMKQAYKNKKYGFVPDYARLDILYQYGGIYMDTDVELVRTLDDMLYQQAFCSVEKWQVINFGGCSGAIKGSVAIKEILKERETVHFINKNGTSNETTCGYYDTLAMMRNGYQINGKNQKILGMNIYTYDYFHCYDYMSKRTEMTDDTFGIHHFNGGWLDEKMKKQNEETAKEFESLYQQTFVNS